MQYSKRKSTMVGDSQVFHLQTEAARGAQDRNRRWWRGGMGAAGGVKAADPKAEVVVYTGFDDVAYSPCGIPYVHGREIENFEKLFLPPSRPTSTPVSTCTTTPTSPVSM